MGNLSTISQELAAQIREARDRANLTQVELAKELGVSHRTVQNWESGTGWPRAAHRRRLAAFLSEDGVAA